MVQLCLLDKVTTIVPLCCGLVLVQDGLPAPPAIVAAAPHGRRLPPLPSPLPNPRHGGLQGQGVTIPARVQVFLQDIHDAAQPGLT